MRAAVLFAILLVATSLPVPAASLPATLTLTGPSVAPPGSLVQLAGKLSIASQGIALQDIELTLDGGRVAMTRTNVLGEYFFDLAAPAARVTLTFQTTWKRDSDMEERSAPIQVRLADLPSPPTIVSAVSSAGRAPVVVTWSPSADDGGAPIARYQVERRIGAGAWTEVASAPANATEASDTGAPLSESPAYRVTVRTARGNATSASIVVQMAPAAPQTVRVVSNPSIHGADVTWLAPSGSEAPSGYRVWRDGALRATTSASVRKFSDPSLVSGATYTYTVTATNAVGEGPESASVSFVTPPGPVTGFAAAPVYLEKTMRLRWDAPPASDGVTAFRIERGGGSSWLLIAQLPGNATTYDVRDLAYSTTYTFRISARNSAIWSGHSFATGRTDEGPYTFQHSTASAIVCPAPPGSTQSGAPEGCGYAATGYVWDMGSSPPSGQNMTLSAWSSVYVKGSDGFHRSDVTFDAWATTWIRGPCPADGSSCTAAFSQRFDRNFTFTTPRTYQVIWAPGFDTFHLPLAQCWDAVFQLQLMHPRAVPNPTENVAIIRLCSPGA